MDLDLVTYVADELDYLSKEWEQNTSEASLRRASTSLRSLFVENKLNLAARVVDLDVRIMAYEDLGAVLAPTDHVFWQAGGAKQNGLQVSSMSLMNRAMTNLEIEQLAYLIGQKRTKSIPVKLGPFLRHTSFIIDGKRIFHEEVIKYVANKLGGAHYDPKRKAGDPLEEKFELLDRLRKGGWQYADKNAIYFELLSIGQMLINSRDIQRLRKKLRQVST